MKLSIEQKQEIYEHLLALDCPDLLAALIAKRSTESLYRRIFVEADPDLDDFTAIVYAAFYWNETPEGHEFWYLIAEDKLLAEREAEDFLPPDEIDKSQPEINIEVIPRLKQDAFIIPYRPPQPQEYLDFIAKQDKVSVWLKVKLFFGKLFYGV